MGCNYLPKAGWAVLGNYICSCVTTPKCNLFSDLCSADTWLCKHWLPRCRGPHMLSCFSSCLCQLSGTVLKCHLQNWYSWSPSITAYLSILYFLAILNLAYNERQIIFQNGPGKLLGQIYFHLNNLNLFTAINVSISIILLCV